VGGRGGGGVGGGRALRGRGPLGKLPRAREKIEPGRKETKGPGEVSCENAARRATKVGRGTGRRGGGAAGRSTGTLYLEKCHR